MPVPTEEILTTAPGWFGGFVAAFLVIERVINWVKPTKRPNGNRNGNGNGNAVRNEIQVARCQGRFDMIERDIRRLSDEVAQLRYRDQADQVAFARIEERSASISERLDEIKKACEALGKERSDG